MRKSVSFRIGRVEGGTAEDVARQLGGWLERTNGGEVVHCSVEDDPEARRRERTRYAGAKRHGLPDGSPLAGMGEGEALAWCEEHGAAEAAGALGVSQATAYRRMASGHVLP